MSDLRKRLAALESAHDPAKCITCELRRMGNLGSCTRGVSCTEPGRTWEGHIKELDAEEAARKGNDGA